MSLIVSSETLAPLSPSLQNLRQRGIEFFKTHGLPTRKDENWKYTSVKVLNESRYVSSLQSDVKPSHDTLKAVSAALLPDAIQIVFINGLLDRTLSNVDELPSGLTISFDVDKLVGTGEIAEKSTEIFADAFEAMSAAYLGQGVNVQIAADVAIAQPLQLHFHTSLEGGPSLMVHPRVRLEVGSRAKIHVVESYSGQTGARYFVNTRTDVVAGANSSVHFVRVQEESLQATQIGRTMVKPMKGAQVIHVDLSMGASLSRQNCEFVLNEADASVKALSLSAVNGSQHVDHSTMIDHVSGGCQTTQIYKSLLGGESRFVFDGKIRIRPQAQKALSEQLNNNLLLSSKAEADSKPQLMIEADDVKAAHGSTVGQINQEELFYLMSRGLSKKTAVPLLAYGFLAGLLEDVENESVRAWLDAKLRVNFQRFEMGET